VIKVCRTAVQLLVHIGSLVGESGGGSGADNAAFLRRVVGSEGLKIQTFHLSHLALSLWSAAEKAQPRCANTPVAAPQLTSEESAVYTELRSLMHEVLLLLGMFSLGAPRNAEALRWRWCGHPTMLHRLCDLPFAYFCEPRLRAVLFPTLLCACLHDSVNLRILTSRLSPEHLLCFLRNASLSEPAASTHMPPAVLIDDPSELPIVSIEYALAARLPPDTWAEATRFFSNRSESPLVDPGTNSGVDPPAAACDPETAVGA
jgi:hypothetical protein